MIGEKQRRVARRAPKNGGERSRVEAAEKLGRETHRPIVGKPGFLPT